MKNKNIILATGIYPPDIGGPATYVKFLEKELPKFGFKIKVVSYGEGKTNDNIYFVSRRQNIFLRYFKYFWQIWKNRKWADVVFAFDPISSGLPVAIFKVIYPKTLTVIRIGGDFLWEKAIENNWTNKPLSEYYKFPKNKIEKIYIALYSFVFKKFDKIFFSTKWQKGIVENFFNIDKSKLFVIDNPFPDVELFEKESFNKKNFLFVGRLIKLKNVFFLVDVFLKFPQLRLDVVGNGPEFLKIKNKIKNSNIKLKKEVSHKDLLFKIRSSYALILPSITDISPNLILEAIKLKIPVILTKECGFKEKYKNLLYFNPFKKEELEQKIQYLLDRKNYQKYLEVINKIDTNRTYKDFAKDLVKHL